MSTEELEKEGSEGGFESMYEIDKGFVEQGVDAEVQKAENREKEGIEEYYGRTTRMSFLATELGSEITLSTEVLEKLQQGLERKRKNLDGWGMAFTARYLKDILQVVDAEKFAEIDFDFSDAEQKRLIEELSETKVKAKEDPREWSKFFAMADHLKSVAPEVYETLNFEDEDIEDGLNDYLKQLGKEDAVQFVHVALSAEMCKKGFLKDIGVSKDTIKEHIAQAMQRAKEDREKGDAIAYAFAASQSKRLYETLV